MRPARILVGVLRELVLSPVPGVAAVTVELLVGQSDDLPGVSLVSVPYALG